LRTRLIWIKKPATRTLRKQASRGIVQPSTPGAASTGAAPRGSLGAHWRRRSRRDL